MTSEERMFLAVRMRGDLYLSKVSKIALYGL